MFADQSGFYLLPAVVRTYALVGKMPILKEHLSRDHRDHRDHLSAMSAITLEGKLYMLEQERAFKGEDVVRFLKHLLHQIPGKLLISYGTALRSTGEERSRIFWRAARRRVQLEQLPGYAPDLNPEEGVWKHLKCVES